MDRSTVLAGAVVALMVVSGMVPALGLLAGRVSVSVEKTGESHDSEPITTLHLKVGEFDPLVNPPASGTRGYETNYYIVQLKVRDYDTFKAAAYRAGCEVYDYLPDGAYLMYVPPDSRGILSSPLVRWSTPYTPYYKVDPALREENGMVKVNVLLQEPIIKNDLIMDGALDSFDTIPDNMYDLLMDMHRGLMKEGIKKVALSSGGRIISEDRNAISVEVPAAVIDDLASMESVKWLEPYHDRVPMMDNVRATNNLNNIQTTTGYTGSGVVVAVADTGCDWSHPEFGDSDPTDNSGKILRYMYDTQYDDDEGHGTCCAGIIAAPGTGSADAMGMAPDAQLIIQEVIPAYQGDNDQSPPGIYYIIQDAANAGADVHSDSWGSAYSKEYDSQSSSLDSALWDYRNIVACFAAGNDGNGGSGDATTLDAEGQAKNAITVGAIGDQDTPSISDDYVSSFSSRGPTSDGRIKPDILACGEGIYTIDIHGSGGYTNGDYTDGYQYFGGTSGATPIVAGASAVVYEAYKDNYFGNNPTNSDPTSAVVKALLINSAEPVEGRSYSPTSGGWYSQGWGELNLNNLFSSTYFIQDEDSNYAVSTGETKTFQVSATGSSDLKVTLVWNDYPGSAGAATALVNDLDLEVEDSSGNIYKGNVFSGVYSTTGGSADSKNNVENVYLHLPAGGIYTIRVRGYNVPQGPQPFALVVSGVATGTGILYLDDQYYNENDTPVISYSDSDFADDGTSGGTISVTVRSEANPSGISVTLTENQDSGFFQGTINWNTLGVNPVDNITVTYTDTSPVTRTLYANATYDEVDPVIEDFYISGMGRQHIRLSWTTNENTRPVVYIKKSSSGTWNVVRPTSTDWFPWVSPDAKESYTKDHTMFVSGLDPDTEYQFYIASFDICDNYAVENNGGSYYTFKTLPAQSTTILLVDDDDGSGSGEVDEYYLRLLDLVYDNFERNGATSSRSLSSYDIVIWDCGYSLTGTLNGSYSPDGIDDRSIISSYISGGGNFILTGMNIAYDAATDFSSMGAPNDEEFLSWYQSTIHSNYNFYNVMKGSQEAYTTISGTAGDPISGAFTGQNVVYIYPAAYGDEISTYSGSTQVFKWDKTGNASATKYDGTGKVANYGFMLAAVYGNPVLTILYNTINWMVAQPTPSSISGTVYDKNGDPVYGARVAVYPAGDRTTMLGIDYTNSSGGYTISGLPAGTYDIVATAEGYSSDSINSVSLSASGTLTGQDFVLGSGSMYGYVLAGGVGLGNVTVWLMENGTKVPYRTAITNETGYYVITGVPNGTYDVMAYSQGFVPGYIYGVTHIQGNDDALANITLQSGRATILLVADDGDAGYLPAIYEPLFMANGYVYDTWSTTQQGTPTQTDLNPYDLVVWINGGSYQADTISSGEASTLQAYLDNGGMLWLIGQDTLYDATQSPQNSTFVKNYLHVSDRTSDKGLGNELYGVEGAPIGDGIHYDITDPYRIGDYSDAIVPDAQAQGVTYQDKDAGTYSGILYEGTYKVVFFAFEVGLIRTMAERVDLVERVVDYLGPSAPHMNSQPQLSSPSLMPATGDFDTLFNFSVTYTDADNDAPAYVKLVLDSQSYDMVPSSSNDGDYTNGETYILTLTGSAIGSGNHTYSFQASDGIVPASGSSQIYHGPFVNNVPEYEYPMVDPTSGDPSTPFTYSIIYKDKDNQAPAGGAPKVYIDGTANMMSLDNTATQAYRDGDYTNGEKYVYTTVLTAGQHTYYFEISDGYETVTTTVTSGPTVQTAGNSLPELYDYSVSPTSGSVGDTYLYSVWYKDADNEAPAFIRVYIDGEAHDMSPAVPTDNYYVDGNEYRFSFVHDTTGTHEFYFEASDGTDTLQTDTVTGPIVSSAGNNAPSLTGGSVDPSTGTVSTLFRFTVTYTDADNEAPVGGGPEIYIDDVSKGHMSPDTTATSDLTDGDYTNGEAYYYETTLPVGSHSFYFKATDGTDEETTRVYSGPVVGTAGNNVSVLKNGVFTPSVGGVNTTFVFSVAYYDADDQQPAYIKIVIDDTEYDMSLIQDNSIDRSFYDGNYINGEMYAYATTLSPGSHTYYFKASDGVDAIQWPSQPLDGPYVSSPPQLSDLTFSPAIGTDTMTYNFSVVYSDPDGDSPDYVRVIVGSNQIDLSPLTRDSTTITYGVSGITLAPSKDIKVYAVAKDPYNDEVKTATIDGPVVDTRPFLSEGRVEPNGGTTNDTYVFSVKYRDTDGDAPSYVRLWLDGTAYEMHTEETDFSGFVEYTSDEMTLEAGDHTFNFSASDGYFTALKGTEERTFTVTQAGGGGGGVTPPTPGEDSDGDGMPDSWEEENGLVVGENDAAGDADGDGVSNLDEYLHGTSPTENDTDGDGLDDGTEIEIGTEGNNSDTDGDGMPDGWEYSHGLSPTVNDAMADKDGDGISNLDEYKGGTDPTKSDKVEASAEGQQSGGLMDYLPYIIGIVVLVIIIIALLVALLRKKPQPAPPQQPIAPPQQEQAAVPPGYGEAPAAPPYDQEALPPQRPPQPVPPQPIDGMPQQQGLPPMAPPPGAPAEPMEVAYSEPQPPQEEFISVEAEEVQVEGQYDMQPLEPTEELKPMEDFTEPAEPTMEESAVGGEAVEDMDDLFADFDDKATTGSSPDEEGEDIDDIFDI